MNKHGGYTGNNQEMLDFSININPLGIPKRVKNRLIQGIDDLVNYPEISGQSSIEKLAKDIDINSENIVLGNGAIELIYLFARSQTKGKVLIIQPTFNEYERALKLYGWETEDYILEKSNNFRINPDELIQKIEKIQPQAVFFCNPNNPTGCVYSRVFVSDLVKASSKDLIWFIDESFMEFTKEDDNLPLIKNGDNLVFLLRSLTKFYALPGLRIGYGIGSESIIKKMVKYKEPWTINGLGLIAVGLAYDEKDFQKQTKDYISSERDRVYQELNKIKSIQVFKSGTDFHLCQLKQGTVKDLQIYLENHGINIRTCEDFKGLDDSYFRIAIKKQENNQQLLEELKKWRG
jgi:threonine-phosphate decarboxylase